MKERPILFSPVMVHAIIHGRKTQTRRVVKLPKWATPGQEHAFEIGDTPGQGQSAGDWPFAIARKTGCLAAIPCPYGVPGDLLWVRESFATAGGNRILYAATDDISELRKKKPSIHMPRSYSRIGLEVTAVRCERVQDISYDDAIAEGSWGARPGYIDVALPVYTTVWANLWDSINASRGYGWQENPWVWVVGFKVIRCEV